MWTHTVLEIYQPLEISSRGIEGPAPWPTKGGPVKYGTANRRSMTYKLRLAAGYSYP